MMLPGNLTSPVAGSGSVNRVIFGDADEPRLRHVAVPGILHPYLGAAEAMVLACHVAGRPAATRTS